METDSLSSGKPELVSYDAEVALMSQYINSMGRPLEILEAGCGRKWPLKLTLPYRLTGIDTDDIAMKSRQQSRGDLTLMIVGDLGTADISDSSFDVIYCSFVLEHVERADRVLQNFARWLKPGGLMVIRVPDRDSVYGWTARLTPFWLHIIYKRWIEGNVNAGKPGFDPYPVHYHSAISRPAMIAFCKRNRFELCRLLANGNYLRKSTIVRIGAVTLSALSLGRLPWRHNNLTFIIRAPMIPSA